MTKPKLPPHRVGFAPIEEYEQTTEDIQHHARWLWLAAIAKYAPQVLETLAEVPSDTVCGLPLNEPDEDALSGWARRWHLQDDWSLAHARATWRHWREYPGARRTYWIDRDDVAGRLLVNSGRLAPRPLKSPEHLRWLVRYQCLKQPYALIARETLPAYQSQRRTDPRQRSGTPIVREACHRLADLLSLTLRTSRGRPRK